MNRALVEVHFVEAQRYVEEGEARLVRQRGIVERLEKHGHTVAAETARSLLATLEEAQVLHVEHLNCLVRELAGLVRPRGGLVARSQSRSGFDFCAAT